MILMTHKVYSIAKTMGWIVSIRKKETEMGNLMHVEIYAEKNDEKFFMISSTAHTTKVALDDLHARLKQIMDRGY